MLRVRRRHKCVGIRRFRNVDGGRLVHTLLYTFFSGVTAMPSSFRRSALPLDTGGSLLEFIETCDEPTDATLAPDDILFDQSHH